MILKAWVHKIRLKFQPRFHLKRYEKHFPVFPVFSSELVQLFTKYEKRNVTIQQKHWELLCFHLKHSKVIFRNCLKAFVIYSMVEVRHFLNDSLKTFIWALFELQNDVWRCRGWMQWGKTGRNVIFTNECFKKASS